MGADVMRWLYCQHNPSQNLNLGYNLGDEIRRRFILPLWNSYAFFVNYAALDQWSVDGGRWSDHSQSPTTVHRPPSTGVPLAERTMLDRWILSRLQGVIAEVRARLDDYDAAAATRALE